NGISGLRGRAAYYGTVVSSSCARPRGLLRHGRLVLVLGLSQLHQLAELLRRLAARARGAHPEEVDAVRQLVTLGVAAVPGDLVVAGREIANHAHVDRLPALREHVDLEVRVLGAEEQEREVRAVVVERVREREQVAQAQLRRAGGDPEA